MNFEMTVARYRKTCEMIDELKECVNTLSAERDALEEDIIVHCANDEGVYDVFRRKNSAAGIVGRNLFTVTFSEQLERTTSGAKLDDQEWLDDLFLRETRCWTGTKKFLRTSKVVADFKAGLVDAAELKRLGMCFGRRAHVVAKRIPNDAELNALRESAESLIDEIGG